MGGGHALRHNRLDKPAHVTLGHALACGDLGHAGAAVEQADDAGFLLGLFQAGGLPGGGGPIARSGGAFGFRVVGHLRVPVAATGSTLTDVVVIRKTMF
jgi:hypothetical protein